MSFITADDNNNPWGDDPVKGNSEARIRAALNDLNLEVLVYKPPDDARNWKPADFLVWWRDPDYFRQGSAMIEVKESPGKLTFPVRDLRPSQRLGMAQAGKVSVPYWLVIWWPQLTKWTISEGARVLVYLETVPSATSLDYMWLSSTAGTDCATRDLAPILRSVLLGEVD